MLIFLNDPCSTIFLFPLRWQIIVVRLNDRDGSGNDDFWLGLVTIKIILIVTFQKLTINL